MAENKYEVLERYKDGTTKRYGLKAESRIEAMRMVMQDKPMKANACVGVEIKESERQVV